MKTIAQIFTCKFMRGQYDNSEEPPPYSGPAVPLQSPPYTEAPAVLHTQPAPQAVPGSYAPAPGVGQTNYGYGSQQVMPQQPLYYGNQPPFNNVVVTQVGPGMGAEYQAPPYDYTTQAFFACLCCFWPTGLIAIMKASASRGAAARGDIYAAHQAANRARQMIRISYIVGVVSIIFACVYIGVVSYNNLNNKD